MNKNCEHCIRYECEDHGEICPFYEAKDCETDTKAGEKNDKVV